MLCAFRPGNLGALTRIGWFDKSSLLPSDTSLADTELTLHLFGNFGPRLEFRVPHMEGIPDWGLGSELRLAVSIDSADLGTCRNSAENFGCTGCCAVEGAQNERHARSFEFSEFVPRASRTHKCHQLLGTGNISLNPNPKP